MLNCFGFMIEGKMQNSHTIRHLSCHLKNNNCLNIFKALDPKEMIRSFSKLL